MRVLIADKFESSGIDGLTEAGCQVDYEPTLAGDDLVEAVGRLAPHVLIVRSTKVPEEVLAAGPLRLVARAGAGYNTIDVAAASRRGIFVSNCPGQNSIAVAELAFAHLASLDRRLPDNAVALRNGEWKKSEFSQARGLYGRTLGLIGVGKIGREMVKRAAAFGMPVVAWSRSLTPERAADLGVTRAESPVEVARLSDAVSVHVALTAETKGLCGTEFFAAMRPGASFVNTSRGEVVDEAALRGAVEEKEIRAGLDVFVGEPSGGAGEFSNTLVALPNVYGTAHIGASTDQAQQAIADETVRIVRAFAETGAVPNVVNLAKKTPAVCALMVRHVDTPGVLASTLGVIRAAGINVQEMENRVFDGAEAAVATIHLQQVPGDDLVARVMEDEHVLDAGLISL